jgi:hypothetical protein
MMEATLVRFLAPFLPYLLSTAQAGAKAASGALGDRAWKSAQRLWGTISPHMGAEALAVANAVAHAPDNDVLTGQLAVSVKQTLDRDPGLRSSMTRIFHELEIEDQVLHVQGTRNVIVQGQGNLTQSGSGSQFHTGGHKSPIVHRSPGSSVFLDSPVDARHYSGDNPWRGATGAAFGFLLIGTIIALVGFSLFGYSMFEASNSPSPTAGFPSGIKVGFGIFFGGGVIASIGAILNRNNF